MSNTDRIEPLINTVISDYRLEDVEDQLINITGYLQNTEIHEDISGINYCKLGGLYYLNGSIEFDSLILDILPEPAIAAGFIDTLSGEKLTIEAEATTLTATTLGTKIISGFYAIQEN